MRQVGGPGGQYSVDHREVVEHFQAAWAQSLAAGAARKLRCPIDDAYRDATPGKVARERQAGRAGTHHEDICLRHAIIETLPGQKSNLVINVTLT